MQGLPLEISDKIALKTRARSSTNSRLPRCWDQVLHATWPTGCARDLGPARSGFKSSRSHVVMLVAETLATISSAVRFQQGVLKYRHITPQKGKLNSKISVSPKAGAVTRAISD